MYVQNYYNALSALNKCKMTNNEFWVYINVSILEIFASGAYKVSVTGKRKTIGLYIQRYRKFVAFASQQNQRVLLTAAGERVLLGH
jgi:hypothetical protein